MTNNETIFVGIVAISGAIGYLESEPHGWLCFGVMLLIWGITSKINFWEEKNED